MVLNIILEHVLRQVVIYYLYLIKTTPQSITISHVGYCPPNLQESEVTESFYLASEC